MPEKYTDNARAALTVLMLANRAVLNTELTKEHKIKLSLAERRKLIRAGLLETDESVRPFVHEITDEGISWCMNNLVDGEPPSRSGPQVRLVFEVMRRVVGYLQQRGLLAEALRTGDLESLIRQAYRALATAPQDWIRLARIRPKLNGAEKSEVDETLLEMMKTGTVHLAPDSNRSALTDADHAAAVRIGGEDKHIIAIEES
ncbi:hypothetical protein [Amycolatopsis sp. 195334CR]|uniref:hypothetical protein n=1 Tax=Amycolatopsis sp. 195334CR TaxID=2814588 RepID=UPI001A8C22EF|nr:hypothetical protein [Amycolatopsis sp. 195334CR]MBN6034745.1 hypothetical protein [Amycolatopsis sp. 195334CR]